MPATPATDEIVEETRAMTQQQLDDVPE